MRNEKTGRKDHRPEQRGGSGFALHKLLRKVIRQQRPGEIYASPDAPPRLSVQGGYRPLQRSDASPPEVLPPFLLRGGLPIGSLRYEQAATPTRMCAPRTSFLPLERKTFRENRAVQEGEAVPHPFPGQLSYSSIFRRMNGILRAHTLRGCRLTGMLLTSTNCDVTTDTPPNDWLCRLAPDRPSYECPKCKEPSMQFFCQRLDMPGREDFFYCCACGSTYEI
jgi:hypothetical protein